MTKSSILDLMKLEEQRQAKVINLIASENLASKEVLAACSHIFNTKYAEGYPGKRYYGGCSVADLMEARTIELACEVFGAEYANVQPHSGTQANQAVYQAFLEPKDRVLAMDLQQGGHLSHGSKVNFSSREYTFKHYGLKADETIDYEQIEQLAEEFKPKLIVAGSSTYTPFIDWERVRKIADKVGALFLADIAHYAGLIAGGVYPSPVQLADACTFTTQKTMRGPRGAVILAKQKHAKMIDRAVFPGVQGGPSLAIIAAKGIAFEEALLPSFKTYAQQVVKNAQAMAEIIKQDFPIVSGKTDCHMFTVKLPISGNAVQVALEANDIIVNKQMIPGDTRSPMQTSGIRIGTPTITTQGYNEQKSIDLAKRIVSIIKTLIV